MPESAPADCAEVLNRARTAAAAGRHADALRDLLWFHEHALEHQPSLYGVRLSFALGAWKDLATIYPPAMQALRAAKHRGEARLANGEGGRGGFHDVVAINRELGLAADTYALYRQLLQAHPTLARQCRDLAIEAIVDAQDYELAAATLPHPESYLLGLSERLDAALARARAMPHGARARREAELRNYCHDVHIALKVLRGLGHTAGAEAALIWAIALVERAADRARVAELLGAR